MSLKFVSKGPIYSILASIQVMAWHKAGAKPLPESILTRISDTM